MIFAILLGSYLPIPGTRFDTVFPTSVSAFFFFFLKHVSVAVVVFQWSGVLFTESTNLFFQ